MDALGRRTLIDSPCIGVCSATALGDPLCRGCGRTFYEVIEWNTYDNERKMRINTRVQSGSWKEKISHE